jgi:outer membrane protein assembly factor BamB
MRLQAIAGRVLALGIGSLFPTLFASPGLADDWPQWRGPERNGISKETGLLREWPGEGPKLLWKISDLGSGFSTPAVVGDRLFVLRNEGLEDEGVAALSAQDGRRAWLRRIGKVGNPRQQPNYPAARSTPTVEGDAVYALGSDGDLVCLGRDTGNMKWHRNLRTDFGGQPGIWAYAESPLIDGDTLICTPGGSNATVVALSKRTGAVHWKCQVPGGDQAAYASAIMTRAAGVKQYVQFLQKGVVGVDASTGKLLWRYDRTAKGSPANIPTPWADGDFIYCASGRSGGALIKLRKQSEKVEADEVYFSKELPTVIGGTIKLGDYFYGTGMRNLMCVEFATGTVKWEDPCLGPGSVCYADGRLYIHGENGDVALVEATPDGYRERGRFTPPNQPQRGAAKAWAYPVVANGRLYLRDFGMVWCYDVARPSALPQ